MESRVSPGEVTRMMIETTTAMVEPLAMEGRMATSEAMDATRIDSGVELK